ncbi:MAG: hypothetical protein HY268_33505 [Deltaproteobacteria bacterium]|nr:hypothetical protein [Deltaproteobacteria bacterium]
MSRFWWGLPGPAGFVSRVVQDLRDGKNVVLCLPEHLPTGLGSAIRYAMDASGTVKWRSFDVSDEKDVTPLDLLFSRFISHSDSQTLRSAYVLSEADSFAGHIVWLEGMTADLWRTWGAFIIEYEHVCRVLSPIMRSVFCVPLVGDPALQPPADDVCLTKQTWSGVVSHLDMLLYAASILEDRQLPHYQRELVVNVIAQIALWDPHVGDRLAYENLDRILNPRPILQDIAVERHWDFAEPQLWPKLWHRGVVNTIDEQRKIHSSLLAMNDTAAEIERRVWIAEVGVMFPYIEEKRQDILKRLARVLKVPFNTRFGETITDLRDLEIGHIESQISIMPNIDPKLLRLVRQLRKIRNQLAHVETLDKNLLEFETQ